MNLAETLASSGAILGGVVVLLAQQFGFLALSDVWPTLGWFLAGVLVGGIALGVVGYRLDRR